MKKLFLLLVFLISMAFSVCHASEIVRVQTRIRTDPPTDVKPVTGKFPLVSFPGSTFWIEYKTEELNLKNAVLLIFDRPEPGMTAALQEMRPRIEELAKKFESSDALVLRTSQSDLPNVVESAKGKILFIAGVDGEASEPQKSFDFDEYRKAGISLMILRDLVETRCLPDKTQSRARNRELVVGEIEKNVCPSVSSSDFLGGPAFRIVDDNRRHIVMMVSDDHYDAGRSFPLFAEYLMDRFPVYCSIVHGEGGSDFMEIDELDSADAMVVFFRRLQVPVSLLEKLKSNLAAGRGLVGFRTASHAFDPDKEPDSGFAVWPEFDREVLGGNYHDHGKNDLGTDVVNVEAQRQHPILNHVVPESWHSVGSFYFAGPVAGDALVLQYGSNAESEPGPLTWIRFYGSNRARVAYSDLGHPDDFNHPPGITVMTNLVLWAAGLID
ncbi:MAG: ThuA domain-containing protein [Thermoguttaceae bacterium]|nr:ThuA domain-containing protein [Thermoguttaceae bacterium]